jgi:hypothetical protein
MKILYLTKGDHVDYQNDCLLIGLKELFGADVVDYNKQSHNYDSYDEQLANKLYGMGMTVTRVLPDLDVDRNDITSKIKNRYYDLIVYGSIWRCNDHLNKILEYYPKEKIIAVDGEDETSIHSVYNLGIPYFKRELIYNKERLFPISFAFPTSKANFCKTKSRDVAVCDPRDRSTYIYKNERDYYHGYQESRVGITLKKAGWDCLRHYEILGNGCLPLFLGLEHCPVMTMTSFPKQLCRELLLENNSVTQNLYDKFAEKFESHFLAHNTTKALALQFLDILSKYGSI